MPFEGFQGRLFVVSDVPSFFTKRGVACPLGYFPFLCYFFVLMGDWTRSQFRRKLLTKSLNGNVYTCQTASLPRICDGKTTEKEFASDPWIWHSIDSFSSVK